LPISEQDGGIVGANNVRATIPVPCPTCKGSGIGADGDTCWSCHGSCVFYLTPAQYARRIGDDDNMARNRPLTTPERKIITRCKTPAIALKLLEERGYNDRTLAGVKRSRNRILGKTIDSGKKRKHINNAEKGGTQ
jgi:hypothetical protein